MSSEPPEQPVVDVGRPRSEQVFGAAAILVGLGVTAWAAALHSSGSLQVFLWNVAFFWLPQLVTLGIPALARARAAIVGVAALASMAVFVGFAIWASSRPAHDALMWLLFPLCLPGVLVGALAGALLCRRGSSASGLRAGLVAAVTTTAGALVNVAAVALL